MYNLVKALNWIVLFLYGVQVAEEEIEAMKLLKMYFPLLEYVKVINISFKCYIGKRLRR